MTMEILEAKEAIREVIDQFANLECDVAAQAKFFTEDTHIMVHMNGQLAMDIHGVAEMVKQFSAFTASVKASHHMNGQQVITVNGDKAQDVHYCRAALLTEQNGQAVIVDNYIRYTDQLVRQDGTWRIAERDQYFLMTETRPVQG
ncbi:MAG: nuclear transport factor 2 family protein [Acidaminococcaceae bacterium]|nr:nuclear transport factor 2 family protein [Acidaminococcaceae bacterium]